MAETLGTKINIICYLEKWSGGEDSRQKNRKCKSPELRYCQACLRDSKEGDVAGGGGGDSKNRGQRRDSVRTWLSLE